MNEMILGPSHTGKGYRFKTSVFPFGSISC